MGEFILFCVLFVCCFSSYIALEGYELPVVPKEVSDSIATVVPQTTSHQDKFIPRNAWIAIRNVSDEKPAHMTGENGFINRNKNWKINFCDNDIKDSFMESNFAGSSILWAYNILNPAIGTSKVEIWRLAVLYLHGGTTSNSIAECLFLLVHNSFVCFRLH
jgi:hypothetical protein